MGSYGSTRILIVCLVLHWLFFATLCFMESGSWTCQDHRERCNITCHIVGEATGGEGARNGSSVKFLSGAAGKDSRRFREFISKWKSCQSWGEPPSWVPFITNTNYAGRTGCSSSTTYDSAQPWNSSGDKSAGICWHTPWKLTRGSFTSQKSLPGSRYACRIMFIHPSFCPPCWPVMTWQWGHGLRSFGDAYGSPAQSPELLTGLLYGPHLFEPTVKFFQNAVCIENGLLLSSHTNWIQSHNHNGILLVFVSSGFSFI